MSLFAYARRAMQVAWVAVKLVVGSLLDRRSGTEPARVRAALEELSGSFLKFGQILSLQIETIPRPYCDALLNLLDRVPPLSRTEVVQVFQQEMGDSPDKVFKEFEFDPIAAASIGQVHRAMLADGTPVAVKVQRPEIREIFRRDVALLQAVVSLVRLLRLRGLYFLGVSVQEFREWLEDELDYLREARNMRELGAQNAGSQTAEIPRVHSSYTTSRILTMDLLAGSTALDYIRMREEGACLDDLLRLGFEPSRFALNIVTNFIRGAFEEGTFHADLHPANLIVLRNNKVGYVDFGIVGTLSAETRTKMILLTLAYLHGRPDEIFRTLLDLAVAGDDADFDGFRRELGRRTLTWYQSPAIGGVIELKMSLTHALADLFSLCRTHGIIPTGEATTYIRAMFLADGLVTRLAPGLDYVPQLREMCEAYLLSDSFVRLFSSQTLLAWATRMADWSFSGPIGLLRLFERALEPPSGTSSPEECARKAPRRSSGFASTLLLLTAALVALALNRQLVSQDLDSLPSLLLLGVSLFGSGRLLYILGRHSGRRQSPRS